MLKQYAEKLNRKKSAAMSLPYAVLLMVSLIVFTALLSQYNNATVVRNVEAASDLAAVEALRKYIDYADKAMYYDNPPNEGKLSSEMLRNEELYIDPGDYLNIRNSYLELLRGALMPSLGNVLRIEIPTVQAGQIVMPSDYATTGIFEYSYNRMPDGSHAYTSGVGFTSTPDRLEAGRDAWYLGGDSVTNSSMAIIRDKTNLRTNSQSPGSPGTQQPTTSYFMTVKTTVVYKTMGNMNRLAYQYLSYKNIFANASPNVKIVTYQVDKGIAVVTIETVAKVTLS